MTPPTNRPSRRRRRPPAIASAFNAAFPLGSLAASIYFATQGQPFFKHFTARQCLIYAAFIVIPWLLFWILIAARRRRLPHSRVTPSTAPKITEWPDNGTVKTLPRPLDEMTPEEIRAWAREDPARAKRLLKWVKREYGI